MAKGTISNTERFLDFRYRIINGGSEIIDDNTSLVVRRNYIEQSNSNYDEYFDEDSGELVYCYYEDGFEYVSSMFSSRMMGKMNASSLSRLAYSVCLSVVHLNKDTKDLDYLEEYCKFICEEVFSKGELLKIDFKPIWKKALDVATGRLEVTTRTAKFLWVTHLSYEKKMEHVRYTISSNKRQKMNNMVEMAVSVLLDENPPIFITSGSVSKKIKEIYGEDIPSSTIRNYLPQFDVDIHKHNKHNFETHDFNLYSKTCTINNVTDAIIGLAVLKKEINKSKVAEQSKVSYPSVLKIWEAPEIQEVLAKYNQVMQ